jgi:ABC-type dipeptide/oligopeptide/nickel transport system permease subunit
MTIAETPAARSAPLRSWTQGLPKFGWITAFAAFVLAAIVAASLLGPVLAPYPPELQRFNDGILLPPGSEGHLLGTDQLARDLLSRLLVGARTSLMIAASAVAIGLFAGGAIGIIAGFWGGVLDAILMRIMDGVLAFPILVLALVIAASLGPNLRNTVIAISVVMVPSFARLVRAQTMRVMRLEYVAAARVAGASALRISLYHIVPNIWGPIFAQAVLAVGVAIPAEATLSFLGLGVQLPTPSWGNMIADGYAALSRSPWVMAIPSIGIILTVTSASVLADALRRRLQDEA